MNISSWLKNKRIGVIYGGRSSERKISLLTGSAILKSLRQMGFNAVGIDADVNIAAKLRSQKIDLAYIALHGRYGEDGTVQGMLEMMDIPYTGCGVASSALAMNKIYSKMVFESAGIPTPKWTAVTSRTRSTVSGLRYPVVVKPASQGSAIGVSIVRNAKEMKPALATAFKYDDQVIIEQFVKGTEITVGVLGGKSLPSVEIVPENEFYDFESKYKPGMSRHIMPPRLPAKVIREAGRLAESTFEAFGCKGVSRIDMIADNKGRLWVLEINTIPGMTETSLLPDEARAAGMDFGGLVLKIIEHSVSGRNY